MSFRIVKKDKDFPLARVAEIETKHGIIETPAFIPVGTQGTTKSVLMKDISEIGAEAVLANTYHLYLEPGAENVEKHGGLSKYMGWNGPTFTDSGGFQAFSLGSAMGKSVSKIASTASITDEVSGESLISENQLAKIDDEGITFKSHRDGSIHRFTPESVIKTEEQIGADIIFVLDEPASPSANKEYHLKALERTHKWAKQALDAKANNYQMLFGIVQGGKFEDLRKLSAATIGEMDFDGFGIGGSYVKEDIATAVRWVNEILPENKPRHLLGIGEPEDLFVGVENGCDTFDCVLPTRLGRNGTFFTNKGKIHILNSKYREDFTPIDNNCECYTCRTFTRSYIAHLFRANEMIGPTLGSIHNIFFIVNLVKKIRQSILDDKFQEFKTIFLNQYYGK